MEIPLHIINRSLPSQVAGYTLRSHAIFNGQKSNACSPTAFVVPRSPIEIENSKHVTQEISEFTVDDIRYLGCGDQSTFFRKTILSAAKWLKKRGIRGLGRLAGQYKIGDGFEDRVIDWIVQNLDFSVIHAHSPSHCFDFAEKIRAKTGRPILYEVRGFYYLSQAAEGIGTEQSRQQRIETELNAMNAADKVSTLGGPMKQHLITLGIPEEKIAVIPNGVTPNNDSVSNYDELNKFGFEQEDFICGCFTNVRKLEGLPTAIHAIKFLKESGHRVKFLIVGDGTQLKYLKDLAAELGCQNEVRFTGRLPKEETSKLYQLLNAYLIPRINEPVCQIVAPVKILDPMLNKVPLVVSDLPALTEHTGENRGMRFVPDDYKSLANAILKFKEDRPLADSTAENAFEWVMQERNWAKIARHSLSVYERMNGERDQ